MDNYEELAKQCYEKCENMIVYAIRSIRTHNFAFIHENKVVGWVGESHQATTFNSLENASMAMTNIYDNFGNTLEVVGVKSRNCVD